MNHRSYNSRELLKLLNSDGWVVVRIKGSHHQLKHLTKKRTVTILHSKKDLLRKTYGVFLNRLELMGQYSLRLQHL
ncbi:MAG: hypothetical protein BGO41_15345 [Clostridiales bacterium 38-18]|nr:MAG: hypothetical protein BGO41_15345 [Clostridiales bacterium 38-18]